MNPGGQPTRIDADVGYGPSTPGGTNGTNVGIVVPGGHGLPYPTGLGPNGNAAAFINNGLIGSHVLPMSQPQRIDKVQQFRPKAPGRKATISRSPSAISMSAITTMPKNDDFANNDWQAYAGYGPASNNNGTHGAALPQNLFTGSFGTGDFINGLGGKQPAAQGPGLQPLFGAELPAGPGQSATTDDPRLQCGLLQSGLYRRLSHANVGRPIPR